MNPTRANPTLESTLPVGLARVATRHRILILATPFMIAAVCRGLMYGWVDTALSTVLACLLLAAMIVMQAQFDQGWECGWRHGRLAALKSIREAAASGMTTTEWVLAQGEVRRARHCAK